MTPKCHTLGALTGLAAAAVTSTAFAAGTQIDVISTLAPVNATNGSGVRGVNALTASQTWTKDNEYFLTDKVFIPNGVTLTIEPGTKIYGITSDPNNTPTNRADDKVGALVAARGGRLVADGTASQPIVFTSVREWEVANNADSPFDPDANIGPAPTSTTAGLWGGIVLLGNAYVCHLDGTTGNNLGNAVIEGFVPSSSPSDDSELLPDAIEYGFDTTYPRDDDDDSGVLRYVSIRHGGYEFDAGKEINGLTLGGVGAGTVIDHIEVYANQDDGIEFFGGTVSTSHIVLAYNQDDSFDFDSGHTGKHQFWLAVQNPGFADGGMESDGIEGTVANNTGYDPAFTTIDPIASRATKAGVTLSKPQIYNATIVGPGRTNTFSTIAAGTGQVLTEKGNHAFIFDDYYNGEVYNSVFDDFSQDLAFFRDNGKSTGATARMAHNTIGRFGTGAYDGSTATTNNTLVTNTNSLNLFFNAFTGVPADGNSNGSTDPQLTAYTRDGGNVLTALDPRPSATSPLLKSNGATLISGAPVPVNYRGAFGSSNWAANWTKFSQSGVLQGAATPNGETGTAPFADADNDGVSDTLEATTDLQDLGFAVGTDNAALFASIYTQGQIEDLVTGNQMIVQKSGANVTLSIPVFRSTTLESFTAAPSLQATFEAAPGKEFYRIEVPSAD
jgi:hypothetical protein